MASQQAVRRRYSVADRVPVDSIMPATTAAPSPDNINNNPDTTDAPVAASVPARDLSRTRQQKQSASTTHSRQDSAASTASMPPPPVSREDAPPFKRGHSRSKSSMCRQVNRLSLTLPIAPPTSDPSRPTPTSASVPPTPIDSAATSPSDANEFIIAIAAQERRVLELREELTRAETDLIILKKKWSSQDASRKRAEQYPREVVRPTTQTSDDEPTSARRSVDQDRRKLLQQSQPSTPQTPQGRRKVMRGGHTRTLSLLSPGKDGAFSLYEDRPDQESVKLPTIERRAAQLTNPNLAKRASWAPRSQPNVPGVAQMAEDFKLGFKAFVDDIRQITVGDEPINGQQLRSRAIESRNSLENQDTVRPSHALRPKVSTVFEPPHSAESSPVRGAKSATATKETQDKAKTKGKHFSWTPLGVDSLDDNDWSNWESPASTKTSRWSGSTMGSSLDDTPDEDEPTTTPSKRKSLGFDSPLLSPKLEEISNMVNRLTPTSLKRTATNLMDEWEKSLTEPQVQQRRVPSQARGKAQNKENSV
ncbi:hypothetical protein BKA56DRAFT_477991 [Ilyonectria sp. MPI-CAGE-AT-0026]|nr:hypothetical protein BKA56DRAFT_477991 [Ilyonectria sp. MPI-CAGE-AT-0026]